MERVIARKTLGEPDHDRAYWMSRPPVERLQAIDILREQYIRMRHVEPGLQRVHRVVERTRG